MPVNRIEEADARLEWIQSFMRSYYCFFVLANSRDQLDANWRQLYSFRHVSNVLLYDIVNSWCKIFGTDSEPLQWKKLVSNQDEFRQLIFKTLPCSEQEYATYHEQITDFRNKFVSHFDPARPINHVPRFEMAHETMIVLNDYLLRLPEFLGKLQQPKPISSYGAHVGQAFAAGLNVSYTSPPKWKGV
jgi:hypothetical protein